MFEHQVFGKGMHQKTIWFPWEIIWWNTPATKSNMFQLQSLSKPRSSSPIGVDISISRARAPGKRGDQCFKEERAAAPLGLRPPTIAQYCPVLPSIAQYSLALPRLAHQLLHCSEASNKSSLRLPSVMQMGGGEGGQDFNSWLRCFCLYVYMLLWIQA